MLLLALVVVPGAIALTGGSLSAEVRTLADNQFWYWTYLVNVLTAWQGTDAIPCNTGHLWSLAVRVALWMVDCRTLMS